MDILIIGGVVAIVLLVALAGLFVLQQRRSGTVKAVAGPRGAGAAPVDERDEGDATEARDR